MGIFSRSKSIDAAGRLIEKTGNALNKLFTSDDERMTHREIMARMEQRPVEMAHELNLIAAGGNWFNAGWRPALGWVGVAGIALFFIPQYVMASILWTKLAWSAEVLPPYPIDAEGIWQLVTLLIGGKVVRSYEKREAINS